MSRSLIDPPVRLMAAPFTAFGPGGAIDLDVIRDQLGTLRADGVTSAFICGTTGEGASLTDAERRQAPDHLTNPAYAGAKRCTQACQATSNEDSPYRAVMPLGCARQPPWRRQRLMIMADGVGVVVGDAVPSRASPRGSPPAARPGSIGIHSDVHTVTLNGDQQRSLTAEPACVATRRMRNGGRSAHSRHAAASGDWLYAARHPARHELTGSDLTTPLPGDVLLAAPRQEPHAYTHPFVGVVAVLALGLAVCAMTDADPDACGQTGARRL